MWTLSALPYYFELDIKMFFIIICHKADLNYLTDYVN